MISNNGTKKRDDMPAAEGGQEGAEDATRGAPGEVASYIADMVLELRNLAADNNMDFLAYLLEMSFQEAFDLAQKAQAGD